MPLKEISIATHKDNPQLGRVFEVSPKAGTNELVTALKEGRLNVSVQLKNGTKLELTTKRTTSVNERSRTETVNLIDDQGQTVAEASLVYFFINDDLVVNKKTHLHFGNGLSQISLGLVFELIKADNTLKKFYRSILGEVGLDNPDSFFSRLKTPNLATGGYYRVTPDQENLMDLIRDLKHELPSDLHIKLFTNLETSTQEPQSIDQLGIPLNIKTILQGNL